MINQYLRDAIKKPAYICAMVLDPKSKLTFWKNNTKFINEHSSISVDMQTPFSMLKPTNLMIVWLLESQSNKKALAPIWASKKKIVTFLYQPPPETNSFAAEIKQFLSKDIESAGIQVLEKQLPAALEQLKILFFGS